MHCLTLLLFRITRPDSVEPAGRKKRPYLKIARAYEGGSPRAQCRAVV